MLDSTDVQILEELRSDGRLSMRELGTRVHLSAPAVAERVRRLQERGIIAGYGATINMSSVANGTVAFINVIMKSRDHARFLVFTEQNEAIREVHRLSGDSCYLLSVEVPTHEALEALLDQVLEHGNYRLNIALSSVSLRRALRGSS